MKKNILIILTSVILISLSACGGDNDNTNITTQYSQPPEVKATATPAAAEYADAAYIGNKNSKKFHKSTCLTLPAEKNRVGLTDREDAVRKGYSPCGRCNP